MCSPKRKKKGGLQPWKTLQDDNIGKAGKGVKISGIKN